jgi:hypothetical protein
MTRVILQVDYDPQKLPGSNDSEKVENLIIPWSQFINDMQQIGCEVKLAINGQFIPLSTILGEKELQ